MATAQDERFGSPLAIWVARLGLLFCAAAALWRAALYVFSAMGGVALEVPEASLTFMPIPDALFVVVFVWLAIACGRPLRAWFIEAGIIAGLLHAATLVSYTIIFNGWTKGEALGFDRLSTYLHVVIPVLVCLGFSGRLIVIGLRRWRAGRQPSAA